VEGARTVSNNASQSREVATQETPLLDHPRLLWLKPNETVPFALALLFGMVTFLSVGSRILQNGTLDAYFYTGLIADYGDIVNRYGATYYATRIAHIMPARALYYLFGFETGYSIHKIALISLAVCSSYCIARRFLDSWLALVIAAWAAFDPQLIRSYLWDYCDGSGVAYTLAFIAFALHAPTDSSRKSFAFSFTAGMFFGLAVNCNIVILATGGMFGLMWLWLQRNRISAFALEVLALIAGFVMIYAVMVIFMKVHYPAFGLFFETVTINTTIWGFKGGAETWFRPLSFLVDNRSYYAILPYCLLVIVLGILGLYKPEANGNAYRDLLTATALFLAGICCLYAFLHGIVHSAALTLFYYLIYQFPSILVVMVSLTFYATAGTARTFRTMWSGCLVVVLAASWVWYSGWRPLIDLPSWGAILLLLGICFLLLIQRRPTLRALGLAAVMLLTAWVPYRSRDYNKMHDATTASLERDVYRGAWELLAIVRETAPLTKGNVGFWYANREPAPRSLGSVQLSGWLDSIQSTHLWSFSRLQPLAATGGMPALDERTIKAIETRRFVVLLGLTDLEVTRGLHALEFLPRKFRLLRTGRFQGDEWVYDYVVVEFLPRAQ
jgi:hypothetical protein